jgi:SAM-dependent methyltransferase
VSHQKKPTLRFESYDQILAFWCVFPVSHAPSASGIAPVLIVIQPQLLQRRAPPMPMFNPRVFSAMRNETARCVYMCLLVCQESAQFAATRVQPQNHPLAHALVPSHEIAEGKSWQEHELARAIERHRSASTTACNGACERHCNSSLKLPETEQGLPLEDNWSLTSERKNIFVLPCERLVPAEGVEDHSGGCCGDGTCTEQTGEDHVSCPADCSSRKGTSASAPLSTAPTIHTTDLFGPLQETPLEEARRFHCAETFHHVGYGDGSRIGARWRQIGSPCGAFHTAHRRSIWLERLLATARDAPDTLPFTMPGVGSSALDLGCGLGMDTRNLARAGFDATGVDVSAHAIATARDLTSDLTNVSFAAHDALSLPPPRTPLQFVFDGTVYCGLRHRYLSRLYALWRRLLTPGETLLLIQCWRAPGSSGPPLNGEVAPIWHTDASMEADFAPVLEVVHKQTCMKNQERGGENGAWCYFLRLRNPAANAVHDTVKEEL